GTGDDIWRMNLGGGTQRVTHHDGVNVPLGSDGHDAAIYWHTSGTERGDLWFVETRPQTSLPVQITSIAPLETASKLAPPREVSVPGSSNLSGLLYLPVRHQPGEKHPAIVWIRGGPTSFSRNAWNPICNWLA